MLEAEIRAMPFSRQPLTPPASRKGRGRAENGMAPGLDRLQSVKRFFNIGKRR